MLDTVCWWPLTHGWELHPLAEPLPALPAHTYVPLCPALLGFPTQPLIQASQWGNLDEQLCCVAFRCFWSDWRQGIAPLQPAFPADPWKTDGRRLVVPAMGKSQLPAVSMCCTQGLEKDPCPGTETCRVALSKSLITCHGPAATSRSSRVLAGALWFWTLRLLPQCTSVTWEIWQLTTSYSVAWRIQLSGQCQSGSSSCLHRVLNIWALRITEDYFPRTSRKEPTKSWWHPAFTTRCLWFNKDSWENIYLFLSWKRPMKTIFLCLCQNISLTAFEFSIKMKK